MKSLLIAGVFLGLSAVGCAADGDDGSEAQVGQEVQAAKHIKLKSLVVFGDSLSDVGTYRVGAINALGGGKYTVNGPDAKTWVEWLASYLALPAPCAAQTGLDGDPAQGLSVPVTTAAGCTGYAQGGARVTNPVGPGNKLLGGGNAILGQLTVPVASQIQNHLALSGGRFRSDDLVLVSAGGNDVFINLATVGGGGDPAAAVGAMATAGSELAGYVKNEMAAKGAKHVVVLGLPDTTKSPFGATQTTEAKALIDALTQTFNGQLQQGLMQSDALFVDTYAFSQQTAAHPTWFGLTNNTRPACNLSPAVNPLGSALVCTRGTLVPDASDRDQWADAVHPTSYGYRLVANVVLAKVLFRGWW